MAKKTPQHKLEYFRITKADDKHRLGEWCWRFKSPNGNITATGGESYDRLSDCEKGFASHLKAIATGNFSTTYIDKGKRLK